MTHEQAIEALQLRGRLEISGDAARLAEFMEGLSVALDALRSSPANNLDFDTTRPRPDFVFRAEKELQKAANDLERAVRRDAPQADIFNLQRKVEYKRYVLGLLKGM